MLLRTASRVANLADEDRNRGFRDEFYEPSW